MTRPRIILADDHRMFAEGLRALLTESYDIVRIVEDGEALLAAVEEEAPDLVITDLSMPKLNGIECVLKLRESTPDLKVILLTMHEEVSLATNAIRAGASGYLLKHGGAKDVLQAVELALQGGTFISPQIERDVKVAVSTGANTERALTPRQREIVTLFVEGLSAKQVAMRLSLSRRTVEFHKYQAMERVGVTTNAALISYALKHGIGPV